MTSASNIKASLRGHCHLSLTVLVLNENAVLVRFIFQFKRYFYKDSTSEFYHKAGYTKECKVTAIVFLQLKNGNFFHFLISDFKKKSDAKLRYEIKCKSFDTVFRNQIVESLCNKQYLDIMAAGVDRSDMLT